METMLQQARAYATQAHSGQRYGELPYTVHLQAVEDVMRRFGITDEDLLVAAWLHDVVEDTDHPLTEIIALFGSRVAELVGRVTEPKGGSRAQRHAYSYPNIRENPDAITLKLCDRIANVESGGKSGMYRSEYEGFKQALYREDDNNLRLWMHLDNLTIVPSP